MFFFFSSEVWTQIRALYRLDELRIWKVQIFGSPIDRTTREVQNRGRKKGHKASLALRITPHVCDDDNVPNGEVFGPSPHRHVKGSLHVTSHKLSKTGGSVKHEPYCW